MTTGLILCGMIGSMEVVLILAVVLLLFGGKKIPELMRGMGKGVRAFKEGMNDIESEIKAPVKKSTPTEEKNDAEK